MAKMKKKASKKVTKKITKKTTTIKKKPAKKITKKTNTTKVKDLKFSKLLTVDQDMSVVDVAKLMTQNKIGAVVIMSPIFDAVGIFTERDLLNRVVSAGVDINQQVVEVMTLSFKAAQLEDDVAGLAEMMIKEDIRHLPVLDGKKAVGMLSMRDIVKCIAKIPE